MTDATVIDTGSGFRIGDVIERTFSILGRNFAPFIILSAIATLPYLYYYWNLSAFTSGVAMTPALARNAGVGFAVSVFLGGFLKILTQAIIVNGAFQDMRQRKVRMGESLRVGLNRFLPIIGVAILYGLGVAFGFILLVVPGLILLTMWYVAIPACVVEKIGPTTSLGRSRFLTKGHRWKLFGLMVLLAIVGGILAAALPAFGRMVGGRFGYVILQYLVQAVVGAFGAILVVVVYRDLRVAKEGVDTDRIAAVFD